MCKERLTKYSYKCILTGGVCGGLFAKDVTEEHKTLLAYVWSTDVPLFKMVKNGGYLFENLEN